MAEKKKKGKKKPPGGASGAPPRSEPRVQIFSKFAGCNFQLATRDFDDLFAQDQDAQTDLMPMQMAIQNNAKIAPFGGIETRQNLTRLFDPPAGKHLTGVATLIGDRLYAACDDMTVHHGLLPVPGSEIEQTAGTTEFQIIHPYSTQTVTLIEGAAYSAIRIKLRGGLPTDGVNVRVRVYDPTNTTMLAYTSYVATLPGAVMEEVTMGFGGTTPTPFCVPASGVYVIRLETLGGNARYSIKATNNPYGDGALSTGANDDLCFTLVPYPVGTLASAVTIDDNNGSYTTPVRHSYSGTIAPHASISQAHTVTVNGMFVSVGYLAEYVGSTGQPPVHTHAFIRINDVIVYANTLEPGQDLIIMEPVEEGDVISIYTRPAHPPDATSINWVVDFYEATEDNTWTCLGYADDRLVGMTANHQIWTGALEDYELANAAAIENPGALVLGDLTCVPATGGISISATATEAQPYRIAVCYTLLNKFGPTLPSAPLTFYANKPANEWTSAAFVQVNGTIPQNPALGVTAVELYFTEGENQQPAFLGRVNSVDPPPPPGTDPPTPPTRAWTFNWTGQNDTSLWVIANLTVPAQNYTTGVPASKMAALDGQLYFWGNPDDPYRIWIGGNPGNRFSVSPGTGGGFVDCEPGSGTIVRDVLKFKTQQGAAIVTALCDNPNSQKEARFNLVESTISLSDTQSVKGWMAEKIAGAVGCKSSNGAVAAGDGLYAVSRYGLAITTLTMEYNSQLQIMYVSDAISPVFLKLLGRQLGASVLFECNGVLYMTFGSEDSTLDNVIFCYDIMLKAWWTYTLDVDMPILNMIHIDYDGAREGIGIITADGVYLLPTTIDEAITVLPEHEVLIESGELTTIQPQQGMQHLAQLEFRFDYFIGEMDIEVTMIDQFGRVVTTERHVHHDTLQHGLAEYIRIDAVVESYKVVLSGGARMRMTHFIAKLYPKSNRIGMSWGFDSRQSHTSPGSLRRTFSSYNDLKEAIIP